MRRRIKRSMAAGIAMILTLIATAAAVADTESVWVMCQPDSYVNIREQADGKSPKAGYAECGDRFETDGKKRNGFLHVYAPVEAGEGWIHLGYIIWEEPEKVYETRHIESKGRVNARRTVDGTRRCWLRNGDEITVYWMGEWAVTNKGFVKAEYIGEK